MGVWCINPPNLSPYHGGLTFEGKGKAMVKGSRNFSICVGLQNNFQVDAFFLTLSSPTQDDDILHNILGHTCYSC